jgi:hypothetical protein
MLGIDGQARFTGCQPSLPILALQVTGSEQGMTVGIIRRHGDDTFCNRKRFTWARITQENRSFGVMGLRSIRCCSNGSVGFA